MKVLMALLILISTIWSKDNIAVYPLKGVGVNISTLNILTDNIQTELVNIDKYDVIGRHSDLDMIIDEQSLQQSGIFNETTITELGQITGASYIIGGRIVMTEYNYNVSVNMYDVNSGKIVKSVGVVYDNEKSLLKYGMGYIAHGLTGQDIKFKQDKSHKGRKGRKGKMVTRIISGSIGITALSMYLHYSAEANEYETLNNVYSYYNTNDYSSDIAHNKKMANIMLGVSGGAIAIFGVTFLF